MQALIGLFPTCLSAQSRGTGKMVKYAREPENPTKSCKVGLDGGLHALCHVFCQFNLELAVALAL